MQVVIPSYTHIYTSIGFCQQHGEQLGEMCRKVLWTKKEQGVLKCKRRMVAKKRLAAGYEYGGMQMQESESIAQGLSLNTLQRIHNQTKGSSNFIAQYYEALIREIMGISLKDMFKIGGMNAWATLQS